MNILNPKMVQNLKNINHSVIAQSQIKDAELVQKTPILDKEYQTTPTKYKSQLLKYL